MSKKSTHTYLHNAFYISPNQRLEHSVKTNQADNPSKNGGWKKEDKQRVPNYVEFHPAGQFNKLFSCLKQLLTLEQTETVFRLACEEVFENRNSGQSDIEWMVFKVTEDPGKLPETVLREDC
jgi:hypothetical protein